MSSSKDFKIKQHVQKTRQQQPRLQPLPLPAEQKQNSDQNKHSPVRASLTKLNPIKATSRNQLQYIEEESGISGRGKTRDLDEGGMKMQVEMLRMAGQFYRGMMAELRETMGGIKQDMVGSFSRQIKNITQQQLQILKSNPKLQQLQPQPQKTTKQPHQQQHSPIISQAYSPINYSHMNYHSNIEKRHQNYSLSYEQFRREYVGAGVSEARMGEKYMVRAVSDIFSIGFNYLYQHKMDFDKVKAYCCQNILSTILQFLIQTNSPESPTLLSINNHLKSQILPYLKLQYPHSQQRETNLQLKQRIESKDIFNNIQFDILYLAKIKVNQQEHSETEKEIMEVVNYLIQVVDRRVEGTEKGGVTYFQKFQKDIRNIFQKVYNKQWTNYIYNLSNDQKKKICKEINETKLKEQKRNNMNFIQIFDQILMQKVKQLKKQSTNLTKQQQQYKQQVKSYTRFKIGRKISPNTPKYSAKQLQKSRLQIKSPSVGRILTKWIQYLQVLVKDPSQIFRQSNQFYNFEKDKIEIMNTENSGRIARVQFYYKVYMEKYYEAILGNFQGVVLGALGRKDAKGGKAIGAMVGEDVYGVFCEDRDLLVGHVCTILEKCLDNYVLNYLIQLINMMKTLQKQSYSRSQILTFKLGDLMRCQIQSKQKQIIAIYEYIMLLSKTSENNFQILRVKDRLNGPNKDIMLNIFYMGKICIQVQLAVKNQSKFIECSDKYSHFIYELTRAILGPIGQLSSIWNKCSPKPQYFSKKYDAHNTYSKKFRKPKVPACLSNPKPQQHQYHSFSDLKHKQDAKYNQRSIVLRQGEVYDPDWRIKRLKLYINLPFQCSQCGILVYGLEERYVCTKCGCIKCFVCQGIRIAMVDREELLKGLQDQQKQQKNSKQKKQKIDFAKAQPIQKMFKQRYDRLYYARDVLTQQTLYYKPLYMNNQTLVFSFQMTEQKIYNLQLAFTENELKNIDYTLVLLLDKDVEQDFVNYLVKQIVQQYWIPIKLKQIQDKNNTLRINLQFLPQQSFKYHTQILKKLFDLGCKEKQRFQQLEVLALSDFDHERQSWQGRQDNNKTYTSLDLSFLSQTPSLKSLKITNIYLQNSPTLPQPPTLQNLQFLQFYKNGLPKELLKSLLEVARNVRTLQIQSNQFDNCQFVPKNYGALTSLKIQYGQIRGLSGLGEFVALGLLEIETCRLESLTDMPKLPNLTILSLADNDIVSLKGLVKIDNLQQLNLSDNKIQMLKQFPLFPRLKKLNLKKNKIKSLQGMPIALPQLQLFDLSENMLTNLSKMPKTPKLQQLNISDNRIQSLKQLAEVRTLVILNISENNKREDDNYDNNNQSKKKKANKKEQKDATSNNEKNTRFIAQNYRKKGAFQNLEVVELGDQEFPYGDEQFFQQIFHLLR